MINLLSISCSKESSFTTFQNLLNNKNNVEFTCSIDYENGETGKGTAKIKNGICYIEIRSKSKNYDAEINKNEIKVRYHWQFIGWKKFKTNEMFTSFLDKTFSLEKLKSFTKDVKTENGFFSFAIEIEDPKTGNYKDTYKVIVTSNEIVIYINSKELGNCKIYNIKS